MKTFGYSSSPGKRNAIIPIRPRIHKPVLARLKPLNKSLLAVLILTASSTIQAHEYWIEADNYTPDKGQIVALTTRVGQFFAGDEVLNIEQFYSDYSVNSAGGRVPVSGSLATTPPAYIEIPESGTYIVGQQTVLSQVKMNPEKFSLYLEKQGLDDALLKVDQTKSDEDPIVEDYSRCVKAIIQSGEEAETSTLSVPLGYTLEIVPYSSPVETNAGDYFTIQLLYQGGPLRNAQISSINKRHSEQIIKTRTDEQGYAEILLPYAGIWMLNAVHIIPATRTDWESFWANLSFSINP